MKEGKDGAKEKDTEGRRTTKENREITGRYHGPGQLAMTNDKQRTHFKILAQRAKRGMAWNKLVPEDCIGASTVAADTVERDVGSKEGKNGNQAQRGDARDRQKPAAGGQEER